MKMRCNQIVKTSPHAIMKDISTLFFLPLRMMHYRYIFLILTFRCFFQVQVTKNFFFHREFKRVKTEITRNFDESGAFSSSDSDSEAPILIKQTTKRKSKMKLKMKVCINCGPKESVKWCKGMCSACYQQS